MCERITMPDGSVAIVCMRGSHRRKAPPRCHACRSAAVALCDHLGCDRPMCAVHRGQGDGKVDYCREHIPQAVDGRGV